MRRLFGSRVDHHITRLGILLLAAALVLGVTNCAPIQHTLSVWSTLGGSVAIPGEGDFFCGAGEVVDLVAEAEEGYRFVNWTGDVDTIVDVEAASTTITMNGNYEITANFEQVYELTVSSAEGGSVTTPGEGVFTYQVGAVVSLVASAASGHRFVSWTGDVDTIVDVEAASTTITMNGDYAITASFVAQYVLTIGSTEGGEVTAPGEGTFTYDAGTVVDLATEADEGYTFMEWTGDVDYVTDVSGAATTVTMNSGYTITASFAKGVWDWYDLDAIRDNLSGSYVLMNNLGSATAGYEELAGPTANERKGWLPIGQAHYCPGTGEWEAVNSFMGMLSGHGYAIGHLFVNRPDEDGVGLFMAVDEGGVIENVGVMSADITGSGAVGVLAGYNRGTVNNSYATGSVVGKWDVGGLVGDNHHVTVSNSHFAGSVTGYSSVGGLIGCNHGSTVINSHFTGSVTGQTRVGGLMGWNHAGTMINSYYNHDEVLINGRSMITIGALFGEDFEQWLADDKFLDVSEKLAQEDGYYVIGNIGDLKELLAFGQDDSLKFRLQSDLDLGHEPNFYIPYLAGTFDGNGRKISNLTLNLDSVSHVGLFGFVDSYGRVRQVGLENVSISGGQGVGGLVGSNRGAVSNCYSSGSVTGERHVGGLVGDTRGTVSNSHFSGSVNGQRGVGGLVGWSWGGTMINSYYNHDEVLINGRSMITIGALFGEDFEQWLADDKFLDVSEKLAQEDGYYVIGNIGDLKELLAFGQDDSLKFRLKKDLDLETEAGFYIPYLAGEFDGNGHRIANMILEFDSVGHVGLIGYLAPGGRVNDVAVENVNIAGGWGVGGLVGYSMGTVSNSCSSGSVTGGWAVGGLVGVNLGHMSTVHNSYSMSSVTGGGVVGGLVGDNRRSTVRNSYSAGTVTGTDYVGGLVGRNYRGSVTHSFWDVEASGQEESAGGVGKSTAEMKDIATFTDAGWNIIAVTPGTTNPAYIWNIVDHQDYPFLSWEPVW